MNPFLQQRILLLYALKGSGRGKTEGKRLGQKAVLTGARRREPRTHQQGRGVAKLAWVVQQGHKGGRKRGEGKENRREPRKIVRGGSSEYGSSKNKQATSRGGGGGNSS